MYLEGILYLFICSLHITVRPLHLKDALDDIWLPSSQLCATFLNILSIVGCNNLLACFGMVHLGFHMWEEPIKAPVEDASGNKGVDVTDGETVNV